MPHASNLPFPFVSKYHIPVLGRKMPILTLPVPSQSPTTGKSPLVPKRLMHLSVVQPSHIPFPLRSRYQVPYLGKKSPISSFPVPAQSPTTGNSPSPSNVSHSSTAQPSNLVFLLVSNFHWPDLVLI